MSVLAFLLTIGFPWSGFSMDMRWALLAIGLSCLTLERKFAFFTMQLSVFLPAACLVAWSWISLTFSPDPMTGVWQASMWTMLLLVAIAAAERGRIDDIMVALGAGMAVNVACVSLQLVGWHPVPEYTVPAGLFYNRDFLAESAALVAVWMFFRGAWAWTVICAMPLMLCGSRVAIVAAALGMVAGLQTWRMRTMAAAFGAFAMAGVWLMFANKLGTLDARWEQWHFALSHLSAFGHGAGWYWLNAPSPEHYAHSDILQAADELGVIPFAILGIFVAWRLRNVGNVVYSRLAYGRLGGVPFGPVYWARFYGEAFSEKIRSATEAHARRAREGSRSDYAEYAVGALSDRRDLDRPRGWLRAGRDDHRIPGRNELEVDQSAATRAAIAAGLVEIAVAFPLHLPVSGFIVAVLAGNLCQRRPLDAD